MGRIKTEHERDMEKLRGGVGIKKAQEMAEAFAKHKARDITKTLLTDSGLAELCHAAYLGRGGEKDLAGYTELLTQETEMVLGQALAIAYAVGFVDCYEGKSLKTLYVPQGTSTKVGE